MTKLTWDSTGSRYYETGLDRGVLYLDTGEGVPWSGITSVTEQSNRVVSSIYFDSVKSHDVVQLGAYKGTLSAFTYPDEFIEYEGYGRLIEGVYVGDQRPKTFGLSYRTLVGSDTDSDAGYKIHILYNVTAVPTDKEYGTLTDDPELLEFQWNISAVPEEVPNHLPSAQIIVDSRYVNSKLLSDIEILLYGTDDSIPNLPPFEDFMELLGTFYIIEVVDNKDGTWTLYTDENNVITMLSSTEFRLDNVNATYLDAETYELTDTQ